MRQMSAARVCLLSRVGAGVGCAWVSFGSLAAPLYESASFGGSTALASSRTVRSRLACVTVAAARPESERASGRGSSVPSSMWRGGGLDPFELGLTWGPIELSVCS